MKLPKWLRDWQVYTLAFLLLFGMVAGGMFALEALTPQPAPTFTPMQLPTK
ncbi:MAG: hypothetical protein JWP85_2089 [Rhodoglobus sp.]|nr:hypothetical protein [Rhodoglobus sp.]